MDLFKKHMAKLIGLLILAYILIFQIQWTGLKEVLAASRLELIGLAGVLGLAVIGFKSLRWRSLLMAFDLRFPPGETYIYSMSALFLSLATPGRFGEFARAYYVIPPAQHDSLGWIQAVSSVIADRLWDVGLLLGIGLFGIMGGLIPGVPSYWAYLGLALGATGLGALCIIKPRPGRDAANEPRAKWRKLLGQVREVGVKLVSLPPATSLQCVLYTLAAYGVYFGLCLAGAYAVGLQVSWWPLVVAMTVSNILSYLPVSFAGLGTREASLWFILKPYDVPLETIVAFGLVIFITTFLFCGLLGAAAYWLRPIKLKPQKTENHI